MHRARGVVADASDLLSRMGEKGHDLVDHLRIKAPTSLTVAQRGLPQHARHMQRLLSCQRVL